MDIQQTITPTPLKKPGAEVNQKPKDGHDEDHVSAAKFSRLLQGMQEGSQATMLPEDAAALANAVDLTSAANFAEMGGELPVNDTALLSLQSLVTQTQQIDSANTDLALQDGSLLLQRKALGLQMGAVSPLTHAQRQASGLVADAQVATVAAGVQPMQALGVQGLNAAATGAGLAVLAEGAGVVDGAVQAVIDGVKADTASEGRVALLGAWKFDDPAMAPAPAMQRLVGQVEQWAAAVAGIQPKTNERVDTAKQVAQGVQWMSSDQGSATALTEQAVQETQQAQDALFDSAPEEPVEDMRFWLQGKNQRAEVVMDKDGQSVRVQVALRGNEAQVIFRADQAQTREMLDASLEQLRDMLQQQGLELTGVSVQADGQGQSQQQGGGAAQSPWEVAPTQHGQVVVPDLASGSQRSSPAQGLSLYA